MYARCLKCTPSPGAPSGTSAMVSLQVPPLVQIYGTSLWSRPPVFLARSGRTGLLKNGINPSRLQEKSIEMQFHIDRREESLYNCDANGVPCGGVFFGNEMERGGSCKLSGQPVFRARAGHGPAQACGAAVWRSTALNGARPVFRSPLPTGERWPIPRKIRGGAGNYFGLTCAGWAANPFCPVKYNKK